MLSRNDLLKLKNLNLKILAKENNLQRKKEC